MRILILLSLLSTVFSLTAFPISRMDYHTPDQSASPMVTATGGLNLTDSNDEYIGYDNPSLLAFNKKESMSISFGINNAGKRGPWEALRLANFINNNQFTALTVNTQQGGLMYHKVVSVHVNEPLNPAYPLRVTYFDYNLSKAQISFAGTTGDAKAFAAGLTVKYMFGRLVYLERMDQSIVNYQFIDDTVKGVSTDLGFSYKGESLTAGLVFYDPLSIMVWSVNPNQHLVRRGAFGVQYGSSESKLTMGVMSTIENKAVTTYHFGYSKSLQVAGKEANKQLVALRAGAYSDNFNGSDNINFSFGTGYYYQMFRIDFSVTSPGMKLDESRYLVSVSLSR